MIYTAVGVLYKIQPRADEEKKTIREKEFHLRRRRRRRGGAGVEARGRGRRGCAGTILAMKEAFVVCGREGESVGRG